MKYENSDYKRYSELREFIFEEDSELISKTTVLEFINLYDDFDFENRQEIKKYRELSEAYEMVLEDILLNVRQANDYYIAMKIKALNIQTIEENEK